MANGDDNPFGYSSRRGRRGSGFSETDALPGSNENSPQYDRVFNPQGENEYSNLPENPNQIEEAIFLSRRNEYVRSLRSELRDALKRVQYWPNAGRFVIPKQNTFAAHLALVREGNTVDIHFDPSTYLYFDRIIAQHANSPELFDPRHRDYAKYENLRDNLAVLRNDIMGIYMNDGSFDPGDEKYLPKLMQIATLIGDALYVGNKPTKAVFDSLDKDLLNIEGAGAANLYEFLMEHQTSDTFLGNVKAALLRIFARPDNQWHLPAIEATPFCSAGLTAPAMRDELCTCSHRELQAWCAELAGQQLQAQPLATPAAVQAITSGERREAINHGHTILEWLRNIKFSDKSLKDFIDTGNPASTLPERDAINALIDAYYDIGSTAFQTHPQLYLNPKIQVANEVLESLEHALQLMAKLEKPRSIADTMQISVDETQQPDKWNEMAGHTVDRLMQTLKGGLEEAVGAMEQQQMDMAAEQEELADRQIEMALANHAVFTRGRRKRKKQASGQGVAKQRKTDQAIRADDYALGQGAHAGRMDKSRDGIVDKTMAHTAQEAQIARTKAQVQAVQETTQTNAASQIDPALVKQLGHAMLKMQKDSETAAANLPPEVVKAMQEQSAAQRLADNKNNPKSPQIGH